MTKRARVWRWRGDGTRFLPGVPPRDIDEGEASELGVVDAIVASDLYVEATSPAVAEYATVDDDPTEEE